MESIGKMLALVACCLLIITAEFTVNANLVELCQNKEINFKSAESLIDSLDGYQQVQECRSYSESIEDLRNLLSDQRLNEDVCSEEAYLKIRHFHLNYIHFYNPELSFDQLVAESKNYPLKSQLKPIPASLTKFFVIFVKQITGACKQTIQTKLDKFLEDKEKISEVEFSIISRCKRESRRLWTFGAQGLLDSIKREKRSHFDKIEVINLNDQDINRKLYVQVAFDDRLKRIQDACLNKFKPIYDEVFVPVIRLQNLGYFDRRHSRLEDAKLAEDEQLTRWFDIIQTCELFKDVEVLHDSSVHSAIADIIREFSHITPSEAGTTDQTNRLGGRVTLLSREEADKLRENNDRAEIVESVYRPEKLEAKESRVQVKMAPRLWLTDDHEMKAELKSFQRDLNKIVAEKTSSMRKFKSELKFKLKSFFQKHKQELVTRDKSSALGRLAAFLERHNVVIRIAMLLVSITVMAVILAHG